MGPRAMPVRGLFLSYAVHVRWPLVLALIGCGRFGFGLGDDEVRDAAIDAPAPFTSVSPIAELNTIYNEDDPSLTGDLLEMYFDSDRPGNLGYGDIWVTRRTSIADPWGTPTLVTELASGSDDNAPEVSLDGLTLYFSSERDTGANNRELFVSTRADRSSPWSTPARILELAGAADESSASATSDGLTLYFQTQRAGSDDIYVARRSAVGQPWSQLAAITAAADPVYLEGQHWISGDGNVLYFTADRLGAGMGDIWMTTRGPQDQFGPPVRIDSLDANEEADPWLTPDQRTIFFTRTVNSRFDIFSATR